MTSKPTLKAALHGVEKRGQEPTPRAGQVEGMSEVEGPRPQDTLPPSRRGKKTVAGHFDPAVSRQLRTIALEHDSTVQGLLTEAINDLFEKYGKPPIA